MKPGAPTEMARAVTVVRDAGRHAASIVMLSILVLFAFIFVLEAVAETP